MEKLGKFFVIEGLSGSGKSTQISALKEKFSGALFNVEPTYELFGAVIRSVYNRTAPPKEEIEKALRYGNVADENGANFWLFARNILRQADSGLKLGELEMQILFMADRVYDLEKNIIPARIAGKTVIQDRYLASTLAYGASGGLDMEELLKWQMAAFGSHKISEDFWKPDLMFILDMDAREAHRRLQASGKNIDVFEEKAERMEKIRQLYLELSKRTDIFKATAVLSADQKPEAVTAQMVEVINLHLTK